jgi:hypothetical protein
MHYAKPSSVADYTSNLTLHGAQRARIHHAGVDSAALRLRPGKQRSA